MKANQKPLVGDERGCVDVPVILIIIGVGFIEVLKENIPF